MGDAVVELPGEGDEDQRMALGELEVDHRVHVPVLAVELKRELEFLFGEAMLILIAVEFVLLVVDDNLGGFSAHAPYVRVVDTKDTILIV